MEEVDQGGLKSMVCLVLSPLTVIVPEGGDTSNPDGWLTVKRYVPFDSENGMSGWTDVTVVPFIVTDHDVPLLSPFSLKITGYCAAGGLSWINVAFPSLKTPW